MALEYHQYVKAKMQDKAFPRGQVEQNTVGEMKLPKIWVGACQACLYVGYTELKLLELG